MDKHFHLPPRHSGYRMFLSGHKLQADTMFVILLFKFYHFFKEINSTKRRFSSLKCVADCSLCTEHRLANQVF